MCQPFAAEPDLCMPSAQEPDLGMETDPCDPAGEQDLCLLFASPDACEPAAVPIPEPDNCANVAAADTCEPNPLNNSPDVCIGDNPPVGDPDICEAPFTDPPDVCSPTFDPDVCNAPGAADEPSPVLFSEVSADSGAVRLPVVGAIVAALGAAALWLRGRLGRDEPEPG